MSYTSNQINQQSLNGILSITDGYITIEDGEISGASKITATEINSDLLISATANIGTLGVGNLYVNKLTSSNIMSNQNYSTLGATYSFSTGYLNSGLLQCNNAVIQKASIQDLTANITAQNINIENANITSANITSANITSANINTSNITTLNILDSLNIIPAGMIMPTVSTNVLAPIGWLFCRGEAVSRTTYNRLFLVIGTIYGTGDGSTTFNLPNFQGAFLRGLNYTGTSNIAGYTTGQIGAFVADKTREHTHDIYIVEPGQNKQVDDTIKTTTVQNNVVTIASTANGKDNRGQALGSETVPYHTMVNYLIKY